MIVGGDVLEQALRSRYAEIVDQREMLRVFIEADASAMRHDGHSESVAGC